MFSQKSSQVLTRITQRSSQSLATRTMSKKRPSPGASPNLREVFVDLLESNATVIVHQSNCQTTHAKGLAESLYQKWPEADVYTQKRCERVPGKVDLRAVGAESSSARETSTGKGGGGMKQAKTDNGERKAADATSTSRTLFVANLFGQDAPGKGKGKGKETAAMREQWFREGLKELERKLPEVRLALERESGSGNKSGDASAGSGNKSGDANGSGNKSSDASGNKSGDVPGQNSKQGSPKQGEVELSTRSSPTLTIAFPKNIGCGLAGGNWKNYEKFITQFAEGVKGVEVLVCKRAMTCAHCNKTPLEEFVDGRVDGKDYQKPFYCNECWKAWR